MNRHHEQILQAVRWIQSATSTVVFTGAGMSTESGIPDFRSPGGHWTKTDPAQVASVEAMLYHYDLFHEFYTMRFQTLSRCNPHRGHRILASWEQKELVQSIATQNVDGFHQQAGSQRVLELHGALNHVRCIHGNHPGNPADFIEKNPCGLCGSKLRPGVVLFGESLPTAVWDQVFYDIQQSDLLLVIGTSLQVSPVNQLPMMAKGKKILINRDPVSSTFHFDSFFQGTAGEVLQELDDAMNEVAP
jgi:NAD-dependent deacetylase